MIEKPVLFSMGYSRGVFYFIPSIRYNWTDCECWNVTLIWGNLFANVFTTCDPLWRQKILGK